MLQGINLPQGNRNWEYEVNNLTLELGDCSRTVPRVEELRCVLDLFIEGKYPQSGCEDVVVRGSVQFRFVGFRELEEDYVPLEHFWHHDRHEFGSEEGDECAHPLYHLTYGGKFIKDMFRRDPNSLGSLFVADAFRISQPPLDIVLAVDFVISNFSKVGWSNLQESPEYQNALAWSQEKFWKPYFSAIGRFWENGSVDDHEVARKLLPQLI